jgi:hypothetical protein
LGRRRWFRGGPVCSSASEHSDAKDYRQHLDLAESRQGHNTTPFLITRFGFIPNGEI